MFLITVADYQNGNVPSPITEVTAKPVDTEMCSFETFMVDGMNSIAALGINIFETKEQAKENLLHRLEHDFIKLKMLKEKVKNC